MREFTLVVEEGEDGYLISEVVELPGCHTQARTMDKLLERTREAIVLCLKEQKGERSRERFVGVQRIQV